MSKRYRQHPLMIFYEIIDTIKTFIFPFIIIFVLSAVGEGSLQGFSLWTPLAFTLLSAMVGILRWVFYTYSFETDSLTVRSGIFVKKERVLKKARVQSVNLEKGVLHRLFSLSSVHIETAGSVKEAEFSLAALHKDQAIKLKQFFETNSEVLSFDYSYHAAYSVLLVAALTSGSIGFILSALTFFFTQIVWYLPERITDTIYGWFFSTGVGLLVIGAALFILLAWLVSIVQYLVRFGQFTLQKKEDALTITRGLLKVKTLTFKAHRIQSIIFVEGLLRQPFKLLTIDVDIAGGVNYRDQSRTSLFPLLKRYKAHDYVQALLAKKLPEASLEPLDKKACKRYLFRAMGVYLIPLAFSFYNTVFLYALFALPLSLLLGFLKYKDAGVLDTEDSLVFRFRRIARSTVFIDKARVQSVDVTQTPFQKWKQFASLHVHILSSSGKATYTIKDVRLKKALDLSAYSVDNVK